MEETCLSLGIVGFPPFSARGCTQDLMPIRGEETHRTVNGMLVTTTTPLHHKYQTVIKGKDKLAVALDQLWKGQDVRVGCLQRIWQKAESTVTELSRDPVEGSVMALDEDRKAIEVLAVEDKTVTLKAPGYVGYRPQLMMKLMDFGYETEEWGEGASTWFIRLEEV